MICSLKFGFRGVLLYTIHQCKHHCHCWGLSGAFYSLITQLSLFFKSNASSRGFCVQYFLLLSQYNQAKYAQILRNIRDFPPPPGFDVGVPFLLGWHICSEVFAIISKAHRERKKQTTGELENLLQNPITEAKVVFLVEDQGFQAACSHCLLTSISSCCLLKIHTAGINSSTQLC